MDNGGMYYPSALQRQVWRWWQEFWDSWVPEVCHGEPYAVLVNGDAVDGDHHHSTTQISHNLADQEELAFKILNPIAQRCPGRFFMVRGTEAHVGQSGVDEQRLAKRLGLPRAMDEAWIRVGKGLVHALHHIGTTGSQAYESTAVCKELIEAYAEAGRWRRKPPDVVIRSHRHRHMEVRLPTDLGYGISLVTAAWQLKTPFAFRIPGARQAMPQIGGSVIRQGDADLYTRHFTKTPQRAKEIIL